MKNAVFSVLRQRLRNIYNPKNIFTIIESVIVALNDIFYKVAYQLKIYNPVYV